MFNTDENEKIYAEFLYYNGYIKEPKNVKMYKFDKFTNGIQEEENKKTSTRKRTKSTITGFSDDTDAEIDPIQIDISDSNIVFDNENSAIFDLRKGNSN